MNFSIDGGGWGFLGFWIILGAVGIGVALFTIFFRETVETIEDGLQDDANGRT